MQKTHVFFHCFDNISATTGPIQEKFWIWGVEYIIYDIAYRFFPNSKIISTHGAGLLVYNKVYMPILPIFPGDFPSLFMLILKI